MATFCERLKRFLVGRRFAAARQRSDEAADQLDAALREVLRR